MTDVVLYHRDQSKECDEFSLEVFAQVPDEVAIVVDSSDDKEYSIPIADLLAVADRVRRMVA